MHPSSTTHFNTNTDIKTDTDVWDQFRKGCPQAFSDIFHRHYRYLYNYGSKLTPDKDLIKDSIQELFIILWQSRSRLSATQSIKFYLLKSFRRHLIKALQANSKIKGNHLPENYQFQTVFSCENDLIAQQSLNEQQQQLSEALNNLSPRQKEIIYLRFYSNLSYQEIAEITSLNYQSVRNYVHQAILALRKKKKLLLDFCCMTLLLLLVNW